MDPTLIRIPPGRTDVHPILTGFPDLPADQYSALKLSIAQHGIMCPLRGVVEESGRVSIFAGRHRRKIAIELGLPEMPVVTNNGVSLLDFVIEEAVTGRQLTKSGIALLLFEKHPALAKTARARKGSFKKAHSKNPNHVKNGDSGLSAATIAENGEEDSFNVIAQRYGVPRDYFCLLTKIRHGENRPGYPKLPPATEEQWGKVKQAIIEDGIALTRIFAGYNGEVATRGKHRSDPTYLMLDGQGNLRGLMPDALTSLGNGFKLWPKLNFAAREKLKGQWAEVMELLPEDLR